ncbi:U-box domain-containing protein 51-like [Panicum virgatum]|uniref:RING-type E3 ubiquitin transferase n=1 Tax=Panicum virgatum TaxID=38727 RepID=A0A8T0UJ21_PANVG|nr:U-box domain-containing protein 51-like [Panicum virgatum]KAG2620834.1 hypothetical protein PVAP13_3NG193800 [Panicum virgatum]
MGRSYQQDGLVAVCIDRDKNSPKALRWAIDSLVHKGQTIILVHVNTKGTSGGVEDGAGFKQPTTDRHVKDLFLPFCCLCARKDIRCTSVVVDGRDVAKAIIEFSANAAMDKLVVGATSGLIWYKASAGVAATVSKGARDFCDVYIIDDKGKVSSTRNAIRAAPQVSPLRSQIKELSGVAQGCKTQELCSFEELQDPRAMLCDRIQRLAAQMQQSEHTCQQLLDQVEEVARKHKEELQKIWDLKSKADKENAQLRQALSQAQVQMSQAL